MKWKIVTFVSAIMGIAMVGFAYDAGMRGIQLGVALVATVALVWLVLKTLFWASR